MPRLKIQTTDAGWTVYRGRRVIGWVRAADAADDVFQLTPGTYWLIAARGASTCTTPYGSVHIAARALERRWN